MLVAGVTDYAIYLLSPEGFVNSWNAGAQRFKGYTADEILGRHFSNFYTPEDRRDGVPVRALQTARDTGKFEDEGWRVRKDGSRFWASVVIDAIRDEQGVLVGFAKITRDITERKRAQEALHASEERFRLLVQGVTDYAIYMLSPDGKISNWNAGAERIKGYTHAEVAGTHFSRFYTEEDRANGLPMRALAKALTEGRFESEGWRVRKDGSRFWAHVVIDPIHSDLGELIGFAKVTRDITERREANEALERAKEALFQSQKLEAIGKLTGGIAHDFNNLLSVVISGIDLLKSAAQSAWEIKTLESMQRAATQGANLTQQLLTFARQQPLKQDKHNVNRLISSFEAVLRRACQNHIEFSLKLNESLPKVMIDATQFESALLNLVVNACDAIDETGKITILTDTVELEQNEISNLAQGNYVHVVVKDTGSGMPQEVISRALEPFSTTKEIGKGTGMGLSQVYGVIRQSGGDLSIKSKVGEGTEISLYIPAVSDELSEEEPPQTPSRSEKVLVVDDQPDVLDLAIALFNTMGYEVLSANNGQDALEILTRTPDIDILFSDVVMPGMSGLALAKAASGLNPKITIILASGYARPALGDEHQDLDTFHFIQKPYRMADIVKKLRMPTVFP
ncbi:PAS domain-containing sensor histidine kinase [soil metagenome]